MTTGKTIALTRWTFVSKVMSLLFNMLSRLVIAFFQGASVLISWLQSSSAVIFGAQEKIYHCFYCFPIFHEVMGLKAMILVFWILSFKPAFLLFSFIFIMRLFNSSLLSAIRVVLCIYLKLLIFLPQILIQLVFYPVKHFAWCTLHLKQARWQLQTLDLLLYQFGTSPLFHVWF